MMMRSAFVSVTIAAFAVLHQAVAANSLQTLDSPTPAPLKRFGSSSAISGNYVLVGEPGEDGTSAGTAYLYDATTGALLQTFTNPTPAVGDQFGTSVALDGAVAVIGAPGDDTGAPDAGAAYVFDAASGALLQTLLPPSGGQLGTAVSLAGTTVLAGAPYADIGAENAGAAYLFDAATGALLQTVPNPAPALDAAFGASVALDGLRAVIGAPGDDTGATHAGAAYLFDATTGALLLALNNPTPDVLDLFGLSVALDGTRVAVGAPRDDTGALNAGAAYLFDAATGALLQIVPNPAPALDDRFGASVALVDPHLLIGAPLDDTGAPDAGAAYVFDAASGTFMGIFPNPSAASGASFSFAVSLSGNRAVVGAPKHDVGTTLEAGRAYLFDVASVIFLHAFENPTPAPYDLFGPVVALSGKHVLVGSPGDDTGASAAGAAYVFDGMSGALLHTLANPDPQPGDAFGYSVAISGNVAIVGALQKKVGGINAGAAYVFDAASGALLQTFVNPTPDSLLDLFGLSVALNSDGTVAVIGAPGDDTGAPNAGAAYVFEIATGALLHVLINPTPTPTSFGISVAASGNQVLVGEPSHPVGGVFIVGIAHLYDATTGALLQTFVNPTPAIGDQFGTSVALNSDGTVAVIGAPGDDTGAPDAGAVYVFDAESGALLQTVLNPAPAPNDRFGAVALDGTVAVIGAPGDDTGAPNAGAAYVLEIATGALLVVNPQQPAKDDSFGYAVSISGKHLCVGAQGEASLYSIVPDADFDAVEDALDNCPAVPNPGQEDPDGDGLGSACDVPMAVNDTESTNEDRPVTTDVVANDTLWQLPITVSIEVNAGEGVAAVNADHTITYTPPPNFYGIDSYQYVVTEADGETATATVSIAVAPVNDPPVATDDQFATVQDVPLTVPSDRLVINDLDADGDSLSVQEVDSPRHGTVMLNPDDSSVTFTPDHGYTGVASFQYTVVDEQAAEDIGKVIITVQ